MPQALAILIITALAIGLLVLFFPLFPIGLAMRAVASNQRAAPRGGDFRRQGQGGQFRPGRRVGRFGGVLITPITTLSYDVGVMLGLKGFAAAILGGFGSFPGAVLGGLVLGLLESLSAAYWSSAYKDVVAFVVLLLVLFVSPKAFSVNKKEV